MHIEEPRSERHVLNITVDNEAGILARIAGLFTARGYNIESLTVADISENHAVSRITIVTNGPPEAIEQISAQLDRLVPVHAVVDLTDLGPHVERELALVKLAGDEGAHAAAAELARQYGARTVDTTGASLIFELADTRDRIDAFIAQVRDFGPVEVGRTGIVGMMRGTLAA